jgi:hypothetical protein
VSVKRTYLLCSFITLCIFFTGHGLLAQPYLGVTWHSGSNQSSVPQRLDSLERLGIQYIELQQPVDPIFLEQLENYDFTILIRSDLSYLITTQLKENEKEIGLELAELIESANQSDIISGLGLFSHSLTFSDSFFKAFRPILNTLPSDLELTYYFVSNDKWYSFSDLDGAFASYLSESGNLNNDLIHFNKQFRALSDEDSDHIVFIDAEWLISATKSNPAFYKSLIDFKRSGNWLFPEPEQPTKPYGTNFLVVLLIAMWAGLAIQIRYLPYVKPMILRFYFAHRFFIDDILHYRERVTAGAVFMLIMHAIFGGIVAYICGKVLISETGMEAFFYHLPFLAITGEGYSSIFSVFTLMILILEFIAILWLHIPAKNLDHISQTLNLYAGPFYLDFIILSVLIPLYLTETWPIISLSLAVLFIFIWFNSFNLTAFNASKSMGPDRFKYLMVTTGLHFLAFAGLLIFLFGFTPLGEILLLAVKM